MKLLAYILLFYIVGNLSQDKLYGQEEESAAVSLEEHTDAFQECFFEALKQKGIENYDKAINHLLECKQLDARNPVVDHELAKAYMANGQPLLALEYGISALNSDPANLWYLETVVGTSLQQGNTTEMIKGRIPYANKLLKENLARVYYRMNNYGAAMEVLRDLNKSAFSEQLAARIQDSLQQLKEDKSLPEIAQNPLEALKESLDDLLENKEYGPLEEQSVEALEQFPSVPYFYYVRGLVLHHTDKNEESVAVLEDGLDYLLDDVSLAEKMYRALAAAYNALGNTSKANMYLSKIKSGS